ncbi:MAG: prephenate dehydrogenase [Treponema sp.]|jgi:prephenate dehydrogenase|nr:prephenate dehydrogenase [Treponema sp.]
MKVIEESCIGIVGLGLMGGAIAIALRRVMKDGNPQHSGAIFAYDIDTETLETAKTQGVIDQGFTNSDEMLKSCDLVFLCLNPSTLLKFMGKHMGAFKTGTLITDIAGVKSGIVSAMETGLRDDLDYIPGHPMAGSEKGGFANAAHCDFHGKNYILTPLKRNKIENLDYLKTLIFRMGFSRITETSAALHDAKIAFTSQLCHVIAAALIDCEADREITRFGGGSFEDLTRIAMLNAPMWTELFIENREELLRRIEQFEGSLDSLKAMIKGGEEKELIERLGLVRDRRAAMSG